MDFLTLPGKSLGAAVPQVGSENYWIQLYSAVILVW